MIKRFKNFLNEYYDSPDIPKVFSEEDLRKAAFADDPYDKTAEFRPFQYGLYAGKASGELNDLINDTQFSIDSMYGVADYLYSELVKNIPDLKSFEFSKNDDVWSNLNEGKIGLHMVKLPGTRFSAESEIWLYYHSKSDKLLDYKKGKLKILFVSGLRPTKKWFSLMEPDKSDSEEEQEARQAFGDMVQSRDTACKGKSCGDEGNLDDKKFDIFLKKLNDIGYGHPDDEDKALFQKLEITHKNLSFSTFFKLLPKIKSNLDYFKRYLKNKYNLKF